MKSHATLHLLALCAGFSAILMLGQSGSVFAQKRAVASSSSASFSVHPVVIVPDDGPSNVKDIAGAKVLSTDPGNPFVVSDLRDEFRNGLSQRWSERAEGRLPGKTARETANTKVIVFVNN